jgi:hypothetical protein
MIKTEAIRYDQGPSIIVPSIPIFLSAGRTNATLDEPVTPKTQNKTAASVLSSFQLGLACVVHFQNFWKRFGLLFEGTEQKYWQDCLVGVTNLLNIVSSTKQKIHTSHELSTVAGCCVRGPWRRKMSKEFLRSVGGTREWQL